MSTFTGLIRRLAASLAIASLATCIVLPTTSDVLTSSPLSSIQSLICYNNAVVAWKLLVYLVTNYLLHAISISTRADIGRYSERVTLIGIAAIRWQATLAIASFFLPMFALARTIIVIAEQLNYSGQDVLAALHHGALFVMVRNRDWKPPTASPETGFVYASLTKGTAWYPTVSQSVVVQTMPHTAAGGCQTKGTPTIQASASEAQDHSSFSTTDTSSALPRAAIFIDTEEGAYYHEITPSTRSLHGFVDPPRGYSLAFPSNKAYAEHLINETVDVERLRIHHPPGVSNVLLSTFQILFACFTLYFTPSDQIPRWGYAAYGLSVFPYALMSLMNVLCAGFVGSYPCGQLLRTHILEEALRRPQQEEQWLIDGMIGKTKVAPNPQHAEGKGYVATKMALQMAQAETQILEVTVTRGGHDYIKKFAYVRPPVRRNSSQQGNGDAQVYEYEFKISALRYNGVAQKEDFVKHAHISGIEIAAIIPLFCIAMCAPYCLIYGLTKFRAHESTLYERAIMMTWLAADQFSSLFVLIGWLVWKRHHDIIPQGVQYGVMILLMLPGMAGIAMVAKMFLEDNHFGPELCYAV